MRTDGAFTATTVTARLFDELAGNAAVDCVIVELGDAVSTHADQRRGRVLGTVFMRVRSRRSAWR